MDIHCTHIHRAEFRAPQNLAKLAGHFIWGSTKALEP